MGTTSDKLTYLNTTKQKLKDSINALGGDITSETTFRNYATELDNIYSSLPKTTGEGSNLSLSPTLKGKLNIEAYKGDTEQEGTPTPSSPQDIEVVRGKNRLNNTLTNKTQQGIEFIVNEDKTIKTNGTATGTSGIVIGQVQLTANETYTLSGCPSNGGSGKYVLSINKTGQSTRLADDTGSGVSYTPTTSGEYDINLNYWYGFNIQNLTFKPMIEKGTQATSYLPYNTLEVVVQNKNLCDGQFRQGGWHDNVGTTRIMTSQDLVIRKGTTLTISTTLDTTQYKYGVVVGKLPYPQTTNPNIYDSGWLTSSSKTFTFNVTGYDIGYLAINVATSDGNGNISPSDIASATWQIELGSTSTSYVEHQEQTKTLHLGDIELAKIGTYQDRISKSSGKNILDNREVKQVLNDSGATRYGYYCEIPKTASYILKTPTQTSGVFYGYSNDLTQPTTAMGNLNSGLYKIANFTQGTYLVIWGLNANTPIDIMFAESSVDIPYEPYGSDKWYIEKKNKQITLGNVPEIKTGDIFGVTCKYAVYRGISDMRRTTTQSYDFYCNRVSKSNGVATKYSGYTIAQNIVVIVDDNDTLESASEKLNGSIFYYPLETFTYEEITNETLLNELNELEKMMSYNGQTNISVSGNLPMLLSVSALKGESE